MVNDPHVTRRTVLKGAALSGTLLVTGSVASGQTTTQGAKSMRLGNSHFYDDGEFSKAKAFQAYYDMMKRFGYPISPLLKTDQFWTSDFAQKDFVNVGMGGIFWVNDTKHMYFGHEIFLLPGQMIVEHRHLKVPAGPAKMETWQVRHGDVYTFSSDEPTAKLPIKLPESQLKANGITARHCTHLQLGEIGHLNRVEEPHFMIAGPEGAIVTEYASPHYGEALKFTNSTVVF
jgi:hypothetical protein